MKTILIILDGVSEEKLDELNDKTPLEYANTPTLNKIIQEGCHKKTIFYPQNREPDSLNCILSILGLEENSIPKNRAYLESIAADIAVEEDDVVLRCNLISYKDNMLESFNGLGLSPYEMNEAAKNVKVNDDIKFYHISDYRNLIVVKKSKNINSLKDIPPHENMEQSMDYMLKSIKEINILNEFVEKNKFKLNDKNYMFYPWGVSEATKLPTFSSIHHKTCSCICNAEIVKGIAKAMDIKLVKLRHTTSDVDTDLYEKSNAVLHEIKNKDVVIAHINGTDEISHRKDLNGKIEFIEKIDREFLSEIYKNIDSNTKLIIVSDHQTSTRTGKHEKGFVDIIMNSEITKEGMIGKWQRL